MSAVPNKTIYVADADMPLFQRAQELTGGNLSAAITQALRRLVEVEEGKLEGFDEIVVKVGTGAGRRQRFLGVLLIDWSRTTKSGQEQRYRVYRSRTGKFVVHVKYSAEFVHTAGADGKTEGLRKYFTSEQQWGEIPAHATLDVYDDLGALKPTIPTELYELVATAATEPVVEDLDI